MTKAEIDIEIESLEKKIDSLRLALRQVNDDIMLANGAIQAFRYIQSQLAIESESRTLDVVGGDHDC